MEWAVVEEGRTGQEGILLILGDRSDAETIAVEVRRKGYRVKVLPYGAGEARTGARTLVLSPAVL